MTTPTLEPVLTLQTLRNAVAGLERVAVGAGSVTEEELDTRRPGGTEYPDDTPEEWLSYHAWIAGRAMGVERPRSTRAIGAVKMDAAIDRPVLVRLANDQVFHVQPKSARALFYMRALDAEIRAIGPEVAELFTDAPVESEALHAAMWGPILQSRLLQIWVWVAVTGIDLPFPEDAADVAPPEVFRALRPQDVVRIVEAHVQVNQLDLEILARHFPQARAEGPGRDVADVLAALAHERGVPTSTLMCAASLRSLYQQALAAALLSADAKRRPSGEG